MKYFVLALIIGLIVFKVFFSGQDPVSSPQNKASQAIQPPPEVPTSSGESPQVSIPSESPVIESGTTPENSGPTENPEAISINPANRIMIDQASPATAGAPAGAASQVSRGIDVGTASPFKQVEGMKLDPSSFLQDQGSHAKIFGNENGGGSPEAKGLAPGGASALPLDNGSPVLRDTSSLTLKQ